MIAPTKADIGRLVNRIVDTELILDEGVMTGWNRKHAMIRWNGSEWSEAVEPRFLVFKYEKVEHYNLADAIVAEIGFQHWIKRQPEGTPAGSRESFIYDISAERGNADNVVSYLIGRLTPRRLALPDDYSCRRQQ